MHLSDLYAQTEYMYILVEQKTVKAHPRAQESDCR